jgi:hypothetical protein
MKGVAALLLAAISFSLLGPALAAASTSQLPACCRRDGKHHCSAMAAEHAATAFPDLRLQARCPQFPSAKATSPSSKADAVLPACERAVEFVVRQARAQHEVVGPGLGLTLVPQERGPPILSPTGVSHNTATHQGSWIRVAQASACAPAACAG